MPIADFPGITSTTRTLTFDRARARSFASAVTLLTFTPGASSTSNIVTTGPGWTAPTSASTPKSISLSSSSRESACSASSEYRCPVGRGGSSSDSGGSSVATSGSMSEICRSFSTARRP